VIKGFKYKSESDVEISVSKVNHPGYIAGSPVSHPEANIFLIYTVCNAD